MYKWSSVSLRWAYSNRGMSSSRVRAYIKNIQWHAMASGAPAKLTKNVLFRAHYRATNTKQLEYPFCFY